MSKKIFIINASPRKNWNTDKMCRGFAQGVKNAGGEAEIIYLYDIDFKGCRSCFACKLMAKTMVNVLTLMNLNQY